MLVTFSNYGVTSVWQTYDGGATWQEKEGNLPDMPVRWGLYYPGDARHALLATETGVWTTDDLSTADPVWVPASEGMANVRVDMLQIRKSDNTVLAATHGLGLFTAVYDISTGVTELKAREHKLFPNPTSGSFTLSMNLQNKGEVTITVMTLSGQVVKNEIKNVSAGPKNLMIDISSEKPGTYIVSTRQQGKIIYCDKIIKL